MDTKKFNVFILICRIFILVIVLLLLVGCSITGKNGIMTSGKHQASKEFSGVQGKNGWYYQYFNGKKYISTSSFDNQMMIWNDSKVPSLRIGNSLQNPIPGTDTVRKWVSPGTGKIRISGTASFFGTSPDGADLSIKRNDKVIWGPIILNNGSGIPEINIGIIKINKGDELYFIARAKGKASSNPVDWDPTVEFVSIPEKIPETYYISSSMGNDGNSGTDPGRPWGTLEKVSKHMFNPGDKILLKCGDIFTGELILHGSGNILDDEWITLSSYIPSDNPRMTERPVIVNLNGTGQGVPDYDPDFTYPDPIDPKLVKPYSDPEIPVVEYKPDPRNHIHAAIKGRNVCGWNITNIQIGTEAAPGSEGPTEYGIMFISDAANQSQTTGYRIENCSFSHVYGGRVQQYPDNRGQNVFLSYAVIFKSLSEAYFNNIKVKDCSFSHCDDSVYVNNANDVTIDDNYLEFMSAGMGFISCNAITISNNTFNELSTDNCEGRNYLAWAGTAAISLYGCRGNITNNEVYNIDNGCKWTDGTPVDAEFLDMAGDYLTIERNYIHKLGGSAFLNAGNSKECINPGIVIKNNIIDDCSRPPHVVDWSGAILCYCNAANIGDHYTIENNTIRKSMPNQRLVVYSGNNGSPDDYGDSNHYLGGVADDMTKIYPGMFAPMSKNTILDPGTPIPFTAPPSIKQKNIARDAAVAVSSQIKGFEAVKAADGIIGKDGSGEWASSEQNPWIQIDWKSKKTIDRIRLYDRRSDTSWLQSGILTFSDGSSIIVNAGIKNNGEMREVLFPEKKVSWVRFTVTRSDGMKTGLSEIQVFEKQGGKGFLNWLFGK